MTSTDLLKRAHAPLLAEAWKEIDEQAANVLRLNLAGRKLVDFDGPRGWHHAAVNVGRLDLDTEAPVPDVAAGLRKVQPLVELRTSIVLDLLELDSIARGAANPELEPVVAAAERMALAEDGAIFHGYQAAGIAGLIDSSPHEPIALKSAEDYPRAVLDGQERLRRAGISGPFALALGPDAYEELLGTTDRGYPTAKLIRREILDGGAIVRSPAIRGGGVLLSTRGGDYELTVGIDLSIGYAHHDRQRVELYLTESFTFRVLEPAAAVRLQRG